MAKKSSKVKEPAVAYEKTSNLSVSDILHIDDHPLDEPFDRLEVFRKGLPRKSFDSLKELSGMDYNTLATALGVSSKTLQRKEVFDTIQSEKIYQLASLYALGINYFGKEGFKRWMDRPLFTLGNRKPLDLIDVSEGIDLLKSEIMKLQYGIAI
ncbi:putative toxin-antitoxin system antitoxin component (TIGR02293 family) [Algoriphagus iocasae]|uniref:Putative toxin-antitoxin system antitoxin component (TIGR02293 family) n=1 Tax=Algoriphagus iocasae TaxID=1836499 RepID=A0A841MQW4_9BACT|nr:antitoxin Xre-like helix-turn-helix domain-containing protein [Algoriphagus iocasae]MBB6325008.1 putative toxin-antitoxin system antitoxin component (TIGR02293 family) [Algoriphagus iocasae]